MLKRGYKIDFAEKLIKQIEGFGKYGFPESHAASFALLVYISAWLKCHLPESFYLGLLNAQPMGFYTPSQLISDAKRHNVEIRPIDINMSFSDCTLESGEKKPSIRLGLSMVKGITTKTLQQILETRAIQPFITLADFKMRTKISLGELRKLSYAGAFQSLVENMYKSNWELSNLELELPLFNKIPVKSEYHPSQPTLGEILVANFSSTSFSLKAHPMQILRKKKIFKYCKKSSEISSGRQNKKLNSWVAGLVTNKQRPGSASGTIFITLEDEEGQINVIVWPNIVQIFRLQILNGRLLKIRGFIQNSEGVINVIARQIIDISKLLGRLPISSRNFH